MLFIQPLDLIKFNFILLVARRYNSLRAVSWLNFGLQSIINMCYGFLNVYIQVVTLMWNKYIYLL